MMMTTWRTLAIVLICSASATAQVVDELSRRQALQHLRAGQELMLAERYEPAAAEFSQAVSLNPLLTIAHYGRGQAYMALRRYASAVQAFLGCREAFEQLARMQQQHVSEASRQETDEMYELRDSIRRMQNQVSVNAATRHRIEQRLEELQTFRRNVRPGGPTRVPAALYLALGSAYFRSGRTAEAEHEWEAAVGADNDLGEAHNNLAALYALSGRTQEAEAAVRAAERAGFRVNPRLKADIANMP